MTGETITIIILGIIIVVQLIFIRNLLIQTEKLDDMVLSNKLEILAKIKETNKKMKEIDIRGSFESDDEVGSVFKDIKQLIENLENQL